MTALEKIRWRLDVLDLEISALLERRLKLSLEAQSEKVLAGLPRVDEDREREIVEASLHSGRPAAVGAMMKAIVEECREAGKRIVKDATEEMEGSL